MLIENTILNLTEPATFSQRSKNLQGQAGRQADRLVIQWATQS